MFIDICNWNKDTNSAIVFLCETDYSVLLFYKPLVKFIVRFQLWSVQNASSQDFVFKKNFNCESFLATSTFYIPVNLC